MHLFDFIIDTRIWVKIVKSKLQIHPWLLNMLTIKQFSKSAIKTIAVNREKEDSNPTFANERLRISMSLNPSALS